MRACFFAGHCLECLHVVQAIGELHQNDADVLDHGQHHFAKALGLGFCAAGELNLIELADAVDECRNLAAKLLFDVLERCDVSSTTSWSMAAAMVCASMCMSASSLATAMGWEIKGSPDMRVWP